MGFKGLRGRQRDSDRVPARNEAAKSSGLDQRPLQERRVTESEVLRVAEVSPSGQDFQVWKWKGIRKVCDRPPVMGHSHPVKFTQDEGSSLM